MSTTTQETAEPMRLKLNGLPLPDDAKQRAAITQRLGGHAFDSRWLPEGLAPELDAARTQHLRRLAQALEAAHEVHGLQERWEQEDAAPAYATSRLPRGGTM